MLSFRSILLLDLVIHLDQVLLLLLLLVLLHELLEHFLSCLLSLLPDVLLDELVDRVDLLLFAANLHAFINSSCSLVHVTTALAFASLSFQRPFFAVISRAQSELRRKFIQLALVICLARHQIAVEHFARLVGIDALQSRSNAA